MNADRKIISLIFYTIWIAIFSFTISFQPGQKPLIAQEVSSAKPTSEKNKLKLSEDQKILLKKYARLEELLLKLARVSNLNDPEKSELLRETFKKGKELQVLNQYEELVKLLEKNDLSSMKKAVKQQKEIQSDLKLLLDLLQSEDRARRIEDQRKRIRKYIKNLNRLIREEKGIYNRTERGDELKPLADRQAKVAKKTKSLGDEIKKNEEGDIDQPPSDPPTKNNDKENPNKKRDDNNPNKKVDSKDPSKNSKPGKKTSGNKNSKPNGKNSNQGKPSADDQQPQDQNNPARQNPAQRRIQAAQEKMRQAQKALDKAKRAEAADKQRQAIKNLEQAKAELERILRQLREEEIQRTLAMLEVRFRKMLQTQQAINEDTNKLAEIPFKQRDEDGDFEIKSGRLARREQQNVFACTKALTLLREEGSAVALPEAVQEVQSDMKQVAKSLSQADIGKFTQAIQGDIVVSLEEIIGALQQAQRDQENKSQNRPSSSGGEPVDPPLIDTLSELRMIRVLQMRVNRMTKRYSQMKKIEPRQIKQRLDDLSKRQQRVFQATHDIATGKNR